MTGPRRSRRRWRLLALGCLLLVGCGGGTEPVTGPTTPQEVPTIAFLRAVPGTSATVPAILDELRAAGFVAGRNLEVLAADPDEAYPEPEEARQAIEDWRRRGVDLIVALSSQGALLVEEVAPEIEVLFLSNDPAAAGLVGDEQRPEGQSTGVSFRVPADRTLDLATRAIEGLEVVGLVHTGDAPALAHAAAIEAAAAELGLKVVTATFTEAGDVAGAVEEVADRGAQALVLSNSPNALRAADEVQAAARGRMPVIANAPGMTSWALLSLYPDTAELGRQLGRQAVRLLSGSSPSSVPVEDPRRFLVTVNLEVAEKLGIEVPEELLREASEVISE